MPISENTPTSVSDPKIPLEGANFGDILLWEDTHPALISGGGGYVFATDPTDYFDALDAALTQWGAQLKDINTAALSKVITQES